MGSIARKISDESEFALATELVFTCLADDADQRIVHKIVSFLGFKNSVLFFTAFGGERLRVPKLDDFTKNVRLAKAALDVVRRKANVLDVARTYSCKVKDVEKAAFLLQENLKTKRKYRKRYLEASSRRTIKKSDVAFQVEPPSEET